MEYKRWNTKDKSDNSFITTTTTTLATKFKAQPITIPQEMIDALPKEFAKGDSVVYVYEDKILTGTVAEINHSLSIQTITLHVTGVSPTESINKDGLACGIATVLYIKESSANTILVCGSKAADTMENLLKKISSK